MESQNREVRKAAFQAMYKTYTDYGNTLGAMYAANAKQLKFYAEVRNYNSALEMQLFDSNIPVSVYDNLIEAVHEYLPAWELCKVLSNLIDNGITALQEKQGERKMTLDISEDRDFYFFSVSNNGPAIPEERKEAIFRQGFTTKREEGHGMGLYIVSGILKMNDGTIRVDSNEQETVFTVKFAKEAKG